MTILGKFFHWVAGVPAWITGALNLVDAEAKILLPIAIKTVEGIKNIMASDNTVTNVIDGIIETVAPTTAANLIDKLRATLNTWLPVILLKLNNASQIVNIPNLQDQLKAAISELKFSSDTAKQMFWNDFAAIVFTDLTTGKATLMQAKILVQEEYDAYQAKLAATPSPAIVTPATPTTSEAAPTTPSTTPAK